MMGSDNADGFEETNLNAQREDMENLDLRVDGDAGGDDPLKKSDVNDDTSNYGYRSAMSTLSNVRDLLSPPPTVMIPADSDPLLAPSSYEDFRSSSSKPIISDNSYIEPPS